MSTPCQMQCENLTLRQEEYDDDMLGFCEACHGRLIGLADDICTGNCECLREESENGI